MLLLSSSSSSSTDLLKEDVPKIGFIWDDNNSIFGVAKVDSVDFKFECWVMELESDVLNCWFILWV